MTELICPECQFNNDADSTFCEECGAMLSGMGEDDGESSLPVFKPGQVIAERYEVVDILRHSSSEASYMALDMKNNWKAVWLKQKMEEGGSQDEFARQKGLFDILIKEPHRNVARPREIFKSDNSIFISVECLKGQTLQSLMEKQEGPLGQEEMLRFAIQAAEGLSFLHARSILHLDIQPSHLFITEDGDLKITGFSRLSAAEGIPADFAVTEGYSPPEAYGLVGGVIGKLSDIYSLGASIYSMITGKVPTLSRESFFTFQPPSEVNSSVDPSLEKIVLKTVKKEPSERFQSVDYLIQALKSIKEKGREAPPKKLAAVPIEMDFDVEVRSHLGKVRSANQDSCLFNRFMAYEKSKLISWNLLVVADGMGGEAEGDKASSLAIRVISREVQDGFMPVNADAETMRLYSEDNLHEKSADILRRAVIKANNVVFDYSRQEPSRRGMGATISAALIIRNNLCICHAGDTRAYIFSKHMGLVQLTEDHSLVGRLVRLGQLTREEALRSPQRSAVYRALGTTPELEVDVYNITLRPGDFILICSDGVWEYFPDKELISIIVEEALPARIADRLISTTLERGADDNATLIVMQAKGQADEQGKTLNLEEQSKGIMQVLEKRQDERKAEDARKEEERKRAEEIRLEEKKREKESLTLASQEKRRKEELEKKRQREELEKKKLSSPAPQPAAPPPPAQPPLPAVLPDAFPQAEVQFPLALPIVIREVTKEVAEEEESLSVVSMWPFDAKGAIAKDADGEESPPPVRQEAPPRAPVPAGKPSDAPDTIPLDPPRKKAGEAPAAPRKQKKEEAKADEAAPDKGKKKKKPRKKKAPGKTDK
jgi:protein phosphatase